MEEEKQASSEAKPINPLLPFIDSNYSIGSVRELISKAMKETDLGYLPENPEELKKVLIEAVDHAVSLKKVQ